MSGGLGANRRRCSVASCKSNISSMDRIEKSYKAVITYFVASNQLTLDWFGESKRRIVDVTSKIEAN